MKLTPLTPLAPLAAATLGLSCAWLGLGTLAHAQSSQQDEDAVTKQMQQLPWKAGPISADLEGKAKIQVPANDALLDPKSGAKFLQLTGNLPSELNVLHGDDWFAVMGFADAGYVKDDETIDPDKLMEQMRTNEAAANQRRAELHQRPLHTDGWYIQPHYDSATKHLEWGVKLHAEGQTTESVNYTVRILGRTGYESATLVSDPERLDHDVVQFKQVLTSFDFNSGEKYSEYRSGDRVAEFGLGALVLGGAAAVAAKTGFWKVLLAGLAASWKLVLAGFAAVGAAVKKLFGRKPSV